MHASIALFPLVNGTCIAFSASRFLFLFKFDLGTYVSIYPADVLRW
jgi:hypothetical protein